MNEDVLIIGDIIIEFTYEWATKEPEVGYLVSFWKYDVKHIIMFNDDIMTEGYDIMDKLSSDDLARIDEHIEEYLNKK